MLDLNKDIPKKEEDQYLLSALKSPDYSPYYADDAVQRGGRLLGFDLTKLLNTHLRSGDTILNRSICDNYPQGYPNVVKFLLKRGADADLATKPYGITPLHNAVFRGNQQITELLIKHNVNINAQDQDGKTALHYLLYNPNSKSEKLPLLQYLVQNKADINIEDKSGKTPIDLMKSKGIDINIENKADGTIMVNFSESSEANDTIKMLGIDIHEE